MIEREIDEDLRREVIDDRRLRLRLTRCQCAGDMPGTCPGSACCPMCQEDVEPDE